MFFVVLLLVVGTAAQILSLRMDAQREQAWLTPLVAEGAQLIADTVGTSLDQLAGGKVDPAAAASTGLASAAQPGAERQRILEILRQPGRRWVIVDCKNGLGNRLRALASAMAVAESIGRLSLIHI